MEMNERFIPVAEPSLSGNELEYVTECIKSGWVSSLGEYIPRFENGFARFCGVRNGIAVSNGTNALHLALAVLGINEGDEVLLPTLTFIATANAVHYTGATPIFVDSEPRTGNLDPADIEGKITVRTKAIIPVHLYGHPADLQPIIDLGKKFDIFIVEDSAEAHGAVYKDKRVGSMGTLGCFSFYGNKIITTGEGGMIITDNNDLAARARYLRDHAMSENKRYWHSEIGFNYRMTNMQAALGVAQLEQIEYFIERKRWIANLYNHLLSDIVGLKLPIEELWVKSVYWMYSILVTEEFPLTRDELINHLRSNRVDSRPFFYPIHQLPPYITYEHFPVAERLAGQGINLPSSVTLSEDDIIRVVGIIKDARR